MTAVISPSFSSFSMDASTRKPRRTTAVCVATTGVSVIFVSMFLLSLTSRQDFNRHLLSSSFFSRLRGTGSPGLPQCAHMLLFTATRHGSTWFVNNVEQCRYTAADGSGRFAPDVMINSELWLQGQQGPLTEIEAMEAARYAKTNNTVKVFPFIFNSRLEDVRTLIRESVSLQVPMAILERKPEAAWASLKEAEKSRVWNRNSMREERNDTTQDYENDPKFRFFRDRRLKYFEDVKRVLLAAGGVYDVFDYEKIKGDQFIMAERNGCYIQNCNFNR